MAHTFSEEIWKSWEKSGRAEFVAEIKSLADGDAEEAEQHLGNAIWELITHGVDGSIKRESVVSTIGEIMNLQPTLAGVITDILNVFDIETACEADSAKREKFYFITRESEQYLTEKLLKERLEIDTLQDVGTVKNKTFYTKFIKVKTKLYYKQRKFNLLREESEGYAKLITELGQEITDEVTPQFMLEVIKSLIGCFNLDPNRVLDVILESFECRPQLDEFFVPLIRSYMADRKILSEVLGYKFTLYHAGLKETASANTEPLCTPSSLYTVTALMLKHDVVSLDDVYGWLLPEDKQISAKWEKENNDAKEYVRKLNIISTKDKEENAEEPETNMQSFNLNQKFGLCEALCRVGAWSHAQKMFTRIPETCLMSQPSIALALCELLHTLIEPVYRKNLGSLTGVAKQPPVSLKVPSLSPKAAETLVDLRDNVIPMLLSLGPSLHLDTVLLYKVIRIAKSALGGGTKKDNLQSKTMYYDVITLMDEVLLPSLSYMEANCSVAEEIWSVLKLLPYQQRYCLYIKWKNESHTKHPALMIKRGDALKKIKNIMKRVSKENVKPVGRSIGKLTHSSPGVLFDYVVTQIQVYDNLINPVVDSLKYLTSLSYDVLGCCLVEALSQADKKRFKHDGTSISQWLQSLASFCGAVFKKYPIDLAGLLQYVANQLLAQKSLDLLIVKEIVQKMAGIEAEEELTAEQLEAMCGGELLRSEAGYFGQAKYTKKSSNRLKESLTEHNLAVALCLLMAQQRYCVVYKETEQSHLKLVGKLFDQCQDTLVQYGTFLASSLTIEEYNSRLPSINNLLSKHYIHSDVAFFLARPMFSHAINNKINALKQVHTSGKSLTSADRQEMYIEACELVLSPVVESVRPLHPPKVWEDISPNFIVTFWSLTSFDLCVPSDAYKREIDKLKQTAQQQSSRESGRNKREQEKTLALIDRLQDELKKQNEHVDNVMARLKKEKDSWFLSRSAKSAKNETITQFLQLCLFPRCTFTAPDALYCAKFVESIHSLKTNNFSTLLCYDRIFCDITYMVTSCTENEANRLGRFLCAMLDTVMRWHKNKETYDEECANFPGFVTKFKVSNQFSDANDHVGYENYRHVCHKWHYKITKALVVCLDSKDYVQIRNSLIILIKILPHFPVLVKLFHIIDVRIEKVRTEEKDKRQDLYILATSYSGQLKARSAKMLSEKDFHLVSEKQRGAEAAAAKVEINTGETAKKVESNGVATENKKAAATTSSSHSSKRKTEVSRESQRKEDRKEEIKSKDRKDRESPNNAGNKWERDRDRFDEGSTRYRDNADAEVSSLSNSSPSASRLSQEPETDSKRRKTEATSKRSEADDKAEKKERSSKAKTSRTEDDKESRKDRKSGRKRDRNEEGASTSDPNKRRKDDERSKEKSSGKAQNGDQERMSYSRERSPYSRERSYDERDKHRRTADSKRR